MLKAANTNKTNNFIPSVFPEIIGEIANIATKKFPAYVTPIKNGLPIVIRKGEPFLLMYPYYILSLDFQNLFKPALKLSKDKSVTVHAVLTTNSLNNSELVMALFNPNGIVPKDLQMHLNVSVFEESTVELSGKNCVSTSEYVFGKNNTLLHNRIFSAAFTKVNNESELNDMVNFVFSMHKNIKGLMFIESNGTYIQGVPDTVKSGIKILNPVEIKKGTIVYANPVTAFLPGENITFVNSLIVNLEGNYVELNLNDLPLSVKGHIYHELNNIEGKKVNLKTIKLPQHTNSKVLELIKIFL